MLDLGLPDIDGTMVLNALKHDLATRHIPVHVISARDTTADIMRKGAIGYLVKPAGADALAAAARNGDLLPLAVTELPGDDLHRAAAAGAFAAAGDVQDHAGFHGRVA